MKEFKELLIVLDDISLQIALLLNECGKRVEAISKFDVDHLSDADQQSIEEYLLLMQKFMALLSILTESTKEENFKSVQYGFIFLVKKMASKQNEEPLKFFDSLRKKYNLDEFVNKESLI